jgi:hypothetical protein
MAGMTKSTTDPLCGFSRMRRRIAAATAALSLLAGAGAATAHAGPPGKWTQVTGIGRDDLNIMRVGLARTNDGVLHVLWTREEAGNSGSVLHSSASANAKSVSGPVTVFTGPGGVNQSVDVVRTPDGGLRAFFAATNVFGSAMASATSSDGGAWTVQGLVSRGAPQAKPVYAASGIGAGVSPGGALYSTWGDSAPGGGGFHAGLDPKQPDGALPGGLKADPDIAADSQSGRVFATWNSLDDEGVVVMPVAPGGARWSIPNSAPELQRRVGITGRLGAPGVFVAYAQGSNPYLADPAIYRVDTGKAQRLTSKDGELISIAAAPEGRLWVFWEDRGTIYATRSNKAASRWGRFAALRAPRGSTSVYDLAGEGSPGPLDLLAHVDPPTGTLSSWHQRVLPPLSFTAKRKHGKTIIRVTDVGDPVAGAKVEVKGHGAKTTGVQGTVAFTLPEGRYAVTASKPGYKRHSAGVRVR